VSSQEFDVAAGGLAPKAAQYLTGRVFHVILIAAISGGFFWLIWIYGSALRDARYFDGWVLTGIMAFQVAFRIAKKMGVSPKSATRWKQLHVFAGYLVIAAFMVHSDYSLPETNFEWALWVGFVLVTVSGIFGTYLVWSLQAKRPMADPVSYERIPALRAELELAFRAEAAETNKSTASLDLPALPHDAWIEDLCATQLKDFFSGPRNFAAHLAGSQRPLKQLTDAIDTLSRYVDQRGKEKLAAIKDLVIEKDRLDFAQVSLGLTRGWLLVHVPVTYALIVITVAHILIVYSFTSGVW
jgi:hypothetical protein